MLNQLLKKRGFQLHVMYKAIVYNAFEICKFWTHLKHYFEAWKANFEHKKHILKHERYILKHERHILKHEWHTLKQIFEHKGIFASTFWSIKSLYWSIFCKLMAIKKHFVAIKSIFWSTLCKFWAHKKNFYALYSI